MLFRDVAIASLAYADAPERFTTAALEGVLRGSLSRLGLIPGTLEALSGITARRFWPKNTSASDAATQAATKALAQANLDGSELGVLINTSVCRDFVEPSTACLVHGNLKLRSTCLNFDLSNACLGFLNGMGLVAQMIERGQVDYGILVNGENSRHIVETTLTRLCAPESDADTLRENIATLTLGSGAAAMILCRADLAPSKPRFVGVVSRAATEYNHLCRGQVDWMRTDTTGLLAAGLGLAKQTYDAAENDLAWSGHEMDHFVLHQVSRVHTEHLAKALEIPLAKVPVIYPEYGNIGPASIPMTLAKAVEEARIRRGDRIGLMGIGSGLNCAMAEVQW